MNAFENLYSPQEEAEILKVYKKLLRISLRISDKKNLRQLRNWVAGACQEKNYGSNADPVLLLLRNMQTATLLAQEIELDAGTLNAVMLYPLGEKNALSMEQIAQELGDESVTILNGLIKANGLYAKQAAVKSDNYRKLLLTFAEDVRVIIIMIADRLSLMRLLKKQEDNKYRTEVAYEATYLYAPLAHRLGLYTIKGELEDTALRFTNEDIYFSIARKLSETKAAREQYIAHFIAPIREKLLAAGISFEMKGRTKSISSIWNKMQKQNADLKDIYDLFAIRIILDAPIEQEKALCWQVYSIVTDMYQPNPKRLKDWLSIPKSNGYESLHITVLGEQSRWVEVQIRTHRMDEVAEKGVAAHWKYKGGKSEAGLDDWLNNVREVLETAETGQIELMKEFKMDLYDQEVFVFTPKGDLYKLAQGATVLDFAFLIHTSLGCKCVGAKVNNKNQQLRYTLHSGDTVEILTSSQQKPKQDWLNIVQTAKARVKIKQSLKELENKAAEYGKELFYRRTKNRKLEIDDAILMMLIKKMGYKSVTDFFGQISAEKLEVNYVIERYVELERKERGETIETRSAEGYSSVPPISEETNSESNEVLVIDGQNIKGIDYKLAKCCNPIFGDDVFGFVSTLGGIKIHRTDCPNALQMRSRFGYRVVPVKWSGKQGSQYTTVLQIVGNDDIGIVTNITSIISKEKNVILRNISIDSHDGLFQGHLTILIDDINALDSLVKKLKTVKGVKNVQRATC